ncbi:MAG: c-type cytochrome domain-containing protein [Bauldia sp.]
MERPRNVPSRLRRAAASAAFLVLALDGPAAQQTTPDWADVGAVFAERCVMCHAGEGAPAGVTLDTLANVIAGGANGPIVVAGAPDASELVRRLRGDSVPRMPLAGEPLTAEAIAMVEAWVIAGMPEGTAATAAVPATPASPPPLPGEPVTFAHVATIFLQRCASCHSAVGVLGSPPEGLRLDAYETIIGGGDRVVVFPGRPEFSEVLRRIAGLAQPAMPFGGPPLSEGEIDLVRRWIAGGAPDAAGVAAPLPVGGEIRLVGTMTGPAEIDGAAFVIDGATRIDDRPAVGQRAELHGVVAADGTVRATRLDDD